MGFHYAQYSACQKIAEALGIKHCRGLEIKMHVDSIMTVKAEFYPEIDGIKQATPIFKEFELIAKKEVKDNTCS